MSRVFLEYQGNQVALTPGQHLIGRGLSCTIRLNDPSVSREHVRLEVEPAAIYASDLGSRNGTRLNGRPIWGRCAIRNGDVLLLGEQRVRILTVGLLTVQTDDVFKEEETKDHQVDPQLAAAASGTGPYPAVPPETRSEEIPLSIPRITSLTCPRCRTRVPIEQRACPGCGHTFPSGPLYATQIIDVARLKASAQAAERRRAPRYPVDVLLLYHSDNLTLNAVARDLSVGGVFVATDLVDQIGTSCEITFLPDARPAVQCRGLVRHITRASGPGDGRAGMGVQFTSLGLGGKEWLATLMKRR